MLQLLRHKWLLTIVLIMTAILGYSFMFTEKIDYNTQVKPLINKKCITCHGGVKKKGGFSLLFRSEALANAESGKPAIVPGDADASEMIRRLTLKDPEERMPYKEHPLNEDEISLLRKWINQGAKWGDHWAYTPVKAQDVPKRKQFFGLLPKKDPWAVNDIDHFIREKLDEMKLEPSQPATPEVLARRVALDLIGMPASEQMIRQFVDDPSDKNYENLVDSLLAQPGFGERWTTMWMDLARYADTKGYERDDQRAIWRYRDWLIKSFNEDKPYNTFLTEQIAGDLLPDATDEQLIATAFHRNTMTNDEGGTDNEEFRTAAVLDRVNTTWEVLMGTTFACVQCHSHPYDPFRHEEYYSFMAFFNNTRDEDTFSEYPLLHEFKDQDLQRYNEVMQWLKQHGSAKEKNAFTQFLKTRQPAINSLTADSFVNSELSDTKWLVMRKISAARIRKANLDAQQMLTIRLQSWYKDSRLEIRADSPKGKLLATILPGKTADWEIREALIPALPGVHDLHLQYQSGLVEKMEYNGMIFDWFFFSPAFPGRGEAGYDSVKKQYTHLLTKGNAVTTPIMVENPSPMARTTQVFERGNWLLKTTAVQPAVPASLNPMPDGSPSNRLGMAKWLIDTLNPLTARTMVNRLWEQLFGQGLVETLEDMGTQGIAPTHPELLDHLAYQFMHNHRWSVKKLLKEMVMSATYRQHSAVDAERNAKDPFNKYYARGPRVRLSAEQVRDQALAVSGALYPVMYGPSVMPWQPPGIWSSPYSGNEQWQTNRDQNRYRRALYTFWKRTSPYPSMLTFDAMAREVCTARRIRTNTPLQALVLMNDQAYLDLSRQMSYRLAEASKDPAERIRLGWTQATGKKITQQQLDVLLSLYMKALAKYKTDSFATCEMAGGLMDEHNYPEMAALVATVHTMMNTDEVITKE